MTEQQKRAQAMAVIASTAGAIMGAAWGWLAVPVCLVAGLLTLMALIVALGGGD